MSEIARQRTAVFLAVMWAGMLWTIALLAAPTLFHFLPREQAGDVAAFYFMVEAYASLGFALVLLLLVQYKPMSLEVWMILLALFSVVLGYFGLQPEMADLRASLDSSAKREQFAWLHGLSSGLFALRAVLASGLGWKLLLAPHVVRLHAE